jgi:transcriptional regulator with XRE-family HTH domain
MELKDRFAAIIEENGFKQIELAELIGVSGSYISTLLAGRNQNISTAVASLIEEKLGYRAGWVLSGEEPKFKQTKNIAGLSDVKNKVIFKLEKMPDAKAEAVLAFIESLDKVSAALAAEPAPVKSDVGELFATFADSVEMTDDEIERLKQRLERKKGRNRD